MVMVRDRMPCRTTLTMLCVQPAFMHRVAIVMLLMIKASLPLVASVARNRIMNCDVVGAKVRFDFDLDRLKYSQVRKLLTVLRV